MDDGSEYPSEVPAAPPLGVLLAAFTSRIPADGWVGGSCPGRCAVGSVWP